MALAEGIIHLSDETSFIPDEDGWLWARCVCGYETGPFPDFGVVLDALMEHAFDKGTETTS